MPPRFIPYSLFSCGGARETDLVVSAILAGRFWQVTRAFVRTIHYVSVAHGVLCPRRRRAAHDITIAADLLACTAKHGVYIQPVGAVHRSRGRHSVFEFRSSLRGVWRFLRRIRRSIESCDKQSPGVFDDFFFFFMSSRANRELTEFFSIGFGALKTDDDLKWIGRYKS